MMDEAAEEDMDCYFLRQPEGWGLRQYPLFRYFPQIFSIVKTHVCYWISRLYLAGVTAAQLKYKCDSNDSRGIFAGSKILLTEKLTNRALVTPAPEELFYIFI